MAAPVVATYVSGEYTGATSFPITISGLSVADGDLMIAYVESPSLLSTLSPPGGWTQLIFDEIAVQQGVWWRIASSEPSSYTWTSDLSCDVAYGILRITGAPTSTPIDTSAHADGTSSGPFPCAEATTTGANELILQSCAYWQGAAVVVTTVPSGYTSIFMQNTGANNNLQVGWINQAVAGSTGTPTWSANYDRAYDVTTVAVKSSGGGGSPTTATLTGPTSGALGSQSTAFTVTLDQPAEVGGVVVTVTSTVSTDTFSKD